MSAIETLPQVPEALTGAQFEELCKAPLACKSEVEIKTGLTLLLLSAQLYENGQPTNGIINVNYPWDVRVAFGLKGPLKELICGAWCVNVHFESIGTGKEFVLSYPEFHFDCHNEYWYLTIPGKGIEPSDCGTPYKVVATVAYHSLCDKPAGIIGFCEFPLVEFYAA